MADVENAADLVSESIKEESNVVADDDSDKTSLSSSRSSSSPLPLDNIGPMFQVKFNPLKKNLESPCVFNVGVQRLDDPELKGKTWNVFRTYSDFTKFDQSLSESLKSNGIVFPPLPEQPHEKSLLYDQDDYLAFVLHHQLEKYLQIVCSHHVLGSCHLLAEFLATAYVSVQERVTRKGFFTKFTESLEIRKQPSHAHKDLDDFFQHERDWLSSYCGLVKEAIDSSVAVISSQRKISGQMKHLCSVLLMNTSTAGQYDFLSSQVHFSAAEGFLSLKDLTDAQINNHLHNLYSTLNFYGRYLQSEQSVLNRRTGLMIDYEMANRNWDKAKLVRKEEAQIAKKEAEQAFEDCSETARHEIRLFHKQRVLDTKQALVVLARNELQTARDLRQTFQETVNKIREISC